MSKYVAVIIVMFLAVYMFGCSKKEASTEITQESLSMEELSKQSAQPVLPGAPEAVQAIPATVPSLGSLPPSGPYKPTAQEIQTALKNANFYTGTVDGKIGPMTKKAIEEFQKVNNLQVDGKVGLKTWAILSPYLNPQASLATPVNKQ
jgi:peptidoglycan hydrolase-like protein with peptidoglycan-binding domain